jgi:hypothetical protein
MLNSNVSYGVGTSVMLEMLEMSLQRATELTLVTYGNPGKLIRSKSFSGCTLQLDL